MAQVNRDNEKDRKKSFWTKGRYLQIVGFVFVLALSVVIMLNREKMAAFGSYGYLGIFLISMISCATIVVPVPGLMMVATFGAVLNPLLVGIASGLGASVGEMTGYILGYSGRLAVENSALYNRMVGWMKRWGNVVIFLLALVPNPAFDVAGAAAGLLGFPLWKFVLLGTAGRIPKHILFAYLGFWGWGLILP